MKAQYFFYGSFALLSIMACSNVDENKEETEIVQPTIVAQKDQTTISLDSFQRSVISTLPGNLSAVADPKNRIIIHREKDSVTFSGEVVVVDDKDVNLRSRQAYRFYFKAAGKYCYAFLKYAKLQQGKAGERKLYMQEAGYSLKIGNEEQVAG